MVQTYLSASTTRINNGPAIGAGTTLLHHTDHLVRLGSSRVLSVPYSLPRAVESTASLAAVGGLLR